jgi:hypothetical protein
MKYAIFEVTPKSKPIGSNNPDNILELLEVMYFEHKDNASFKALKSYVKSELKKYKGEADLQHILGDFFEKNISVTNEFASKLALYDTFSYTLLKPIFNNQYTNVALELINSLQEVELIVTRKHWINESQVHICVDFEEVGYIDSIQEQYRKSKF